MNSKKIHMTLSENTIDKLEELSYRMGVNKSSIVSIAVEKYYSEEEKRAAK
jgi:metal-responsive CopG/Arc/MetJ family transcriptional regulator